EINLSDGAVNAADLIKNGSTDTFMADVIDGSKDHAVIVDFWAEWCGPCKQLGPALEKAVKDARGAVKLVKIDVDKNQEPAARPAPRPSRKRWRWRRKRSRRAIRRRPTTFTARFWNMSPTTRRRWPE